jgi:hypothetical protein
VVPGQARKMEKLCMMIISYPLLTHKEQITTHMKRQRNVDHQSKSIVGVPQTTFAKKHRTHTQPMKQVNSGPTCHLSIYNQSVL